MARIRKNDNVLLLSGRDKGKTGIVIDILPKKGKVMVKDCHVQTRHAKGGIKKQEAFISLHNVMPVCPACKKPCRINAVLTDNGKRARACNRCKKVI